MNWRIAFVPLLALATLGCGGSARPPASTDPCVPAGCFVPQQACVYLNRNAIFVANTGSGSISAFQNPGPNSPVGDDPVCGSPFPVDAPPTALTGNLVVVVLSAPGKTVSLFKADPLTSVLTGPTASAKTAYTPEAIANCSGFLCVANAEGSVSVYQASWDGTSIKEIAGSPFPAGSGPAAIGALAQHVYVANSQSNSVSAFSQDPATGALTQVPGSPFLVGADPRSIQALSLNPYYRGPSVVIVANAGSNSASVFSINGDGSLAPVAGSPFPTGALPSSIAPNYNFYPVPYVFVANSKSNDISVFKVDDTTGALTPVAGSPFPTGGSDPASIAVGGAAEFAGFGGPNGAPFLYTANAGSNNMSVFSINLNTGVLTPVSGSPFAVGKSPQSVIYIQVPQD
jgi:6-phosphogluconolactonase (cycloisomerase 2 family)